MKLLNFRWFLLIVVSGAGLAGVVSSNVGCGDSNDSTGTAGTSGGGGSTGTAGTGAGGSKPVKLQYTFDTATSSDSMSWKLNDYIDGTPAKNLGAFSKPDAGLTLSDPPSAEWSTSDSEGSASSGSMKIAVTFTEYGQYVDPVINFPAMDLSNSIVSMKLRLVSGTFTGGVQFHISTTSNYLYWAGTWINGSDLTAGTWKQTNIDTSIPPSGADPAMVVQIGIQFAAGAAPDGGSTPPSGRLVFEIDTVQAR